MFDAAREQVAGQAARGQAQVQQKRVWWEDGRVKLVPEVGLEPTRGVSPAGF